MNIHLRTERDVYWYTKWDERPSHHIVSGYHRPTSEMPFEWRFARGPMVARFSMFTGVRGVQTGVMLYATISIKQQF